MEMAGEHHDDWDFTHLSPRRHQPRTRVLQQLATIRTEAMVLGVTVPALAHNQFFDHVKGNPAVRLTLPHHLVDFALQRVDKAADGQPGLGGTAFE